MNKEDYVSLEVAKLLEEKGCNLSSDRCYIGGRFTESDFIEDCDDVYYSAPTLYEAQKWLREKYHIAVNIYNVLSTNGVAWKWEINNIEKCKSVIDRSESFIGFDTYEEALNAGILEALKTI